MLELRPRHYVLVFVLGFLLVTAGALWAQDSTVVVDRTGLFGPVLDKFWPVIVTFLTSLTVKIIARANAGFARTGELVKWVALYAFALLYNLLSGWLNLAAVDPTAPVFALSAVQMAAAAGVYKLARHRTPTVG